MGEGGLIPLCHFVTSPLGGESLMDERDVEIRDLKYEI